MKQAARELETERLRFRQLRESDFPTYEKWCANIDVMRYIGGKTLEPVLAWRHMSNLLGHWTLRGYGYYAVEGKMEMYDLHATMLHLLGMDHKKLTYRFGGRDMRLTDVHGEVVREILA